MGYSLNSLKGGCIGDDIWGYYKGYKGRYSNSGSYRVLGGPIKGYTTNLVQGSSGLGRRWMECTLSLRFVPNTLKQCNPGIPSSHHPTS